MRCSSLVLAFRCMLCSQSLSRFSPSDFLLILRQHITNHYTRIDSSCEGDDVEARIISSMILALFSVRFSA